MTLKDDLLSISHIPHPQHVTDRTCLRALEKIKSQLGKGGKESDPGVVTQDVNTTTAVLQNENGKYILT